MSTYKVAISSELMQNYRQADILDPQKKFIALQSSKGASLLFSIDGVGGFYLTREVTGDVKNKHGWIRNNLGGAQINQDFPGGAKCKDFAAAQAMPGAPAAQGKPTAEIHLAMVVDDGTNDHLYLSLHNSDVDLSWTASPAWLRCPFNAVDFVGSPITPPAPFHITGVWIGEATDKEYIVVDIARDPNSPAPEVSRFYIDGASGGSPVWRPHDLAVDMKTQGSTTCLGRCTPVGREEKRHPVDGLYTSGTVGGTPVLLYKPLYNIFDRKAPPSPSRLQLTADGKLVADAIAACRKPDNTSDLYAVAQGGLYWFSSDNQKDGATAMLVATNPRLVGARALYAYVADGVVTVWGLNGNDQVFYLSSPLDPNGQPTTWTVPLPIMSGVDAISPYIDRGYSAKTFFAHSAIGLVKLVKSPATSLWSQRHITLAPSKTTNPATPISSYTTRIHVTDTSGQAAANVPVKLIASNVISVYINHLYYVLGPSPVDVATDVLGTITIVETTTSLGGTRFGVTVASQPGIAVNTMDSAWQRNAKYTTVQSLKDAKIVNRDGSTRSFVPAGTSDDDLKQVANSNTNLAQAYTGMASKPLPLSARPLPLPQPGTLAAASGVSGILVDLGDLLRWLESAFEAVVEFVKDVITEAWHLVVTIGEDIYRAVLDCVEAIVAAATWIYNAIKIAVEDIIKFLEFLFRWQDIIVTHNVLKNLILCLSRHAIGGIQATKADLQRLFQQAQHEINGWAGIPDFNQTVGDTSAANPPPVALHSAPANLGVHHFQGNCADSSSGLSPLSPAAAILQDLVNLMEAEGETISNAAKAIKTDIIDKFSSLSATDIIKKLLAIITDTLLQTVENTLSTLLDVVAKLMEGMIAILTAKLDIPVLSWLYKDLTGSDLSFLDLICLVAAIPITVVYKFVADKAPFPEKDAFTQGLINAKSFAEIHKLFVVSQRPARTASLGQMVLAAESGDVLDQAKLKTFGFVTGIFSLVGAVVLIPVMTIQRVADVSGITITYAKTLATIGCVGNIAYVLPNIATLINAKTDNWYADFNNALTILSILKGMAAIPAAAWTSETTSLAFAFVESIANIAWNVPVIANIMVNQKVWNTSYRSLIPESMGNFAFNIGGILDFPTAADNEPIEKIALAATQYGLMLFYGVFMIVAGAIYEFVPDQHH